MTVEPIANPRKTPRQARAEATVEAIEQAAARILVQGGIEALNTNRIAEVAGVSVGSLYQYFPNKTAIMGALIRRKRARLLDGLRAAVASDAPPNTHMRRLILAFIHHQTGWPQLAQALDRAEVFLPLDEETRRFEAEILSILLPPVTAFGPDDPALAARDIMALCRGMVEAALLRGETDAEAICARLLPAITGYLKASSA
ncbi:TetR/AcrR family transcriptional regulator [Shimia biformata]|uniref:TetR/AcrR family transcriptional regulator n=1 Tax=Shimia biformata TaxID=1294299 RepID=UPI001952011D|nr:TetR/AcrR family transcriptional regulator [Shimia biformata]